MKTLMAAALLCAAMSATADEKTLGTGVTLKEATPIAQLTADPGKFVGKTIRIDGVATAVCEEMGCWLAVAPEHDPTAQTVRLKVEDGVIVFPMSAKGRKVSAQGVFEAVGGDTAAHDEREHGMRAHAASDHPAREHAAHDAHASTAYQIKATGAVIK
jgi:hypothetical protein